jgi:hypothetical protein
MIDRDIPLNTDSMTFRNCALAGKGASLTMGELFNLRYTALFTRRTSAKNFFELCQEAASHEK